jgi:hypothetical protein
MRGTARENRVRLVVGSVLVALAAAVALTSAAAAGADAAKQRVVITMKALPDGQFVLEPLQAGALKGDMGTTSIVWGDPRNVIRDGQSVDIYYPVTVTLRGKRGTLTLRERSEWIPTGDALVATGTWKVVRGTGAYANVSGHGRSAHVGHDQGNGAWFARHEGVLSLH